MIQKEREGAVEVAVPTQARFDSRQPTASSHSLATRSGTRIFGRTIRHPLAQRYLCISPMSVEVERLFSGAGQVMDVKRSRLEPEDQGLNG